MIITVESVHKYKDVCEYMPKEDHTYYRGDYLNPHYNNVRCKIDTVVDDEIYCVPRESIWLNDVIGFSNNMLRHQKYDCVLEIESFSKVDLNTNHINSIRGFWRNKVPEKYMPQYSLFREQECIDVGESIILISSYNQSLSKTEVDGTLIELIVQSGINLKHAHLLTEIY